tara:strand:+ start:888 stop:1358 length:471 start_codon:yes stop_codon:yes gene_type:complete
MILHIFNNVLKNPDDYVKKILKNGFEDVTIGNDIFKSVKERGNDEIAQFVLKKFISYNIALNFVRQSPLDQTEPNFVHKDDMMGDLTVITYLNKQENLYNGTTLYDNNIKPMCMFVGAYNRMIVFDAHLNHSRNIYENFGKGDLSRLIQVTFLKKK